MMTSSVKALTHACPNHDRSIVKPLDTSVSIEHPGIIQGILILKIQPQALWVIEAAVTFRHQSPFKEGEVPLILKRLRDSDLRRHADAIAARNSFRAKFGCDWFASEESCGVASEEVGDVYADLDRLLLQDEPQTSPHAATYSEFAKSPHLRPGLFAGEPSYLFNSREPDLVGRDVLTSDSFFPTQDASVQAEHAGRGVNAKTRPSKQSIRPLSTPGRAGLVAKFHFSHTERVVAISELHQDLDRDQLQALLKTDTFIQTLMQSYQGVGDLPGWDKFVSPEMKQYFRLHLLCTKPDAKAITIRLNHDSAEAALAAPRGPANYLAEIIKRTLAKLGIETDLAFNLEFNHTGSMENHPLHIHGALCVPDDRVREVSGALRKALAEGYRQRYNNLAVLIETPRSAHWWAAYSIKEYSVTGTKIGADGHKSSRPDYATRNVTQMARAYYLSLSAWLAERPSPWPN